MVPSVGSQIDDLAVSATRVGAHLPRFENCARTCRPSRQQSALFVHWRGSASMSAARGATRVGQATPWAASPSRCSGTSSRRSSGPRFDAVTDRCCTGTGSSLATIGGAEPPSGGRRLKAGSQKDRISSFLVEDGRPWAGAGGTQRIQSWQSSIDVVGRRRSSRAANAGNLSQQTRVDPVGVERLDRALARSSRSSLSVPRLACWVSSASLQ